MEATSDEIELINKYLKTGDKGIIQHVIEHPWAYSVPVIQVAIAIEYHNMLPQRMVCNNSILIKQENIK